jgi:hypothetical protein
MKSLKVAVAILSLSATVAYAQVPSTSGSAAGVAQTAQTGQPAQPAQNDGRVAQHAAPASGQSKTKECVGPVSFCNTFFGS